MSNPHVKVSHAGDHFIYQHSTNCTPIPVSPQGLHITTGLLAEGHEKTEAALDFLSGALDARAATGQGLGEYEIKGVAAICNALARSITHIMEERNVEIETAAKIAAGEVDNV